MFNLSRLEDTAKEQGVTKTHLCSLVGRPKYYINDIKNKGLSVPESYIETWAKALHTTPEYLKGETDVKEKTPAEADVTFDDFTYALHGETKELTEENKQKLLEMARFFKMQQDKEKK